jgi:hypothetical protein
MAPVHATAGPADARRLTALDELEDTAKVANGFFASARPVDLARQEITQARRLQDPALRRHYLRIGAARRQWATALGEAEAAKARNDSSGATIAQMVARQADEQARRLHERLVVSGYPP